MCHTPGRVSDSLQGLHQRRSCWLSMLRSKCEVQMLRFTRATRVQLIICTSHLFLSMLSQQILPAAGSLTLPGVVQLHLIAAAPYSLISWQAGGAEGSATRCSCTAVHCRHRLLICTFTSINYMISCSQQRDGCLHSRPLQCPSWVRSRGRPRASIGLVCVVKDFVYTDEVARGSLDKPCSSPAPTGPRVCPACAHGCTLLLLPDFQRSGVLSAVNHACPQDPSAPGHQTE